MIGALAFIGYIATIPLANYLIDHVGVFCIPNGPCVVPVAPGIYCPSGSLMIGWALVLRDVVQRAFGAHCSLAAILIGAAISGIIAPPALVIASTAAFLVSEFADFAVYTPLYRKRFVTAVAASAFIGLIVDSALFLWLAFGSLDLIVGIVIGKIEMVLIALPLMFLVRNHYARIDR